MNNILPNLRGLNFWTLKQKIKDHTIQRTSTIQLLHKIDIYQLNDADYMSLQGIKDGKKQQEFLKTHGFLKRSTGDMKSHSFVKQFLQILETYSAHAYAGTSDAVTVTDTSNTGRAFSSGIAATHYLSLEAPSTNANYGILVGTGTDAPATTDYKMQTVVAHGSAATQLNYQATTVGAAGIVSGNTDLVVSRVFINSSGGTVTLREVGLASDEDTNYYFLWAHDAVNQAVANTEVAIVAYVIRTTV